MINPQTAYKMATGIQAIGDAYKYAGQFYNWTRGVKPQPPPRPFAYYGRRKNKKGKSKLRLGKKHVHTQEEYSGNLNSTTKFRAFNLWNVINIGDKLDERQSNNILSRYIAFKLSMYNTVSTPRFVRILLVQLRGSTATADTLTWSDLFMVANFTPSAPTGLADQLVLRVNGDAYRTLYDKVVRVGGSGSDKPDSTTTHIMKTRKMIKYDYNNSAISRSGAMYLVLVYGEAEGLASNPNDLHYCASVRHAYTDVDN